MKAKTPFGILMNLLDIPPIDLSDYLHIDRTTISKWRTGRRKLQSNSPYFEQILTFFIKKNEENIHRPLTSFLAGLYPDEDLDSTLQIYHHLSLYLCSVSQETPALTIRSSIEESSCRIFEGVEGRRAAFDFVLTQAEKMVLPGTIKILELEQMTWLCRDLAYMQSVTQRIKQLARRNFQIDFAFSPMQSQPMFMSFLTMLNEIRFNKKITKYVLDTDRVQGILPRVYSVSDACVAVGLDSDDLAFPIHTNLFCDPLNSHKYSKFFDRVVQLYGNQVLVTDSGDDINHILNTIDYLRPKKSDILYYGSQLSITTMSQPLFLEVLAENNIQGNARTRCLSYYQCLRQSMAATSQNYTGVYFFDLSFLEQSLSYEYVIDHELSALTNRQICKSPEQYKRHLKETVEFFEEYDHLKAMLLSGNQMTANTCVWVKKNLWSMACNTVCVPDEYQVIFWDNVDLVNTAVEVCNHQVKNNYSVEHRQKQYNLDVLSALSRGEII